MQKYTITLLLFLFVGASLQAQILLDVEGEGRIQKRLILGDINDDNLFIGSFTGVNTTPGIPNSFDGLANIFIGNSAGSSNTSGRENIFVGQGAGARNEEGIYNTFIGDNAGVLNLGDGNTFFGWGTGNSSTTGNNNIFIGRQTGTTNEIGSNNILIGASADVLGSSLSNAVAIGTLSKVNCSNCAVIGGSGSFALKVGITTTTPLSDLHIKQSTDQLQVGGGIRLENADDTDYWSTTIDDLNDYNFIYNGGVIGWISSATGDYVNNNPFTSPNESESRSRKSNSLKEVLPRVQQLQPLTKKITDDNRKETWGFQAEEVAQLFPAIIPEKNGQKGIIYDYFGILSIKAIQELSVLVEEQQSEITDRDELIQDQQTAIEDLQADVAELKALLEKVLSKATTTTIQSATIDETKLGQNLPNPFNNSTQIPYTIPNTAQKANMLIHSINGQLIKTIAINSFGEGMVELQTIGLSKGQYIYSLEVDGHLVETRQMQLVR